jgi:hypothetical protein
MYEALDKVSMDEIIIRMWGFVLASNQLIIA